MTAAPVTDEPSAPADAAFVVTPAVGEARCLVFASPHSGDARPADMGAVEGLSQATLRSAEDVGVDALVASGPRHGVPLIAARISRAYVDLNRAPDEMDPSLVEGIGPGPVSAKVAAGFGVVPRRAGDGSELYGRTLGAAEAAERIARVHRPYHAALGDLMTSAKAAHSVALLIDWHSMPSRAAGARSGPRGGRGVDIVLGDRHGAAARGGTTRRVRALFEAEGLRVALNTPYAGGYATQTWGRPGEGFQAVQIEINRALYLDEATLEPSADHPRLVRTLERIVAAMAREPWSR